MVWRLLRLFDRSARIPIIIITAKDNDTDKSLGLNLGADDYVVKPFSLIELTARIKANIRRARTYQAISSDAGVKIKDLEIDPISHTVSRQGTLIDLTPIEFEILHLLATHRDRLSQKNAYTNSFGESHISEMKCTKYSYQSTAAETKKR